MEHYLPVIEDSAFIAGASHWNLIDFSSALRDESMPRINNKGILRADRQPKDVFYYYRAAWRNDVPTLHIASRDWPQRAGVIAEGEAMMMPIKVYTNLAEVEMKADGTEQNDNADVPRDASVAAIIASVLYELSLYVDAETAREYHFQADRMVDNLTKHYRATAGSNRGFLLLHSTGHHPANSEIDVPLVYADYYYLEATARRQNFLRRE